MQGWKRFHSYHPPGKNQPLPLPTVVVSKNYISSPNSHTNHSDLRRQVSVPVPRGRVRTGLVGFGRVRGRGAMPPPCPSPRAMQLYRGGIEPSSGHDRQMTVWRSCGGGGTYPTPPTWHRNRSYLASESLLPPGATHHPSPRPIPLGLTAPGRGDGTGRRHERAPPTPTRSPGERPAYSLGRSHKRNGGGGLHLEHLPAPPPPRAGPPPAEVPGHRNGLQRGGGGDCFNPYPSFGPTVKNKTRPAPNPTYGAFHPTPSV